MAQRLICGTKRTNLSFKCRCIKPLFIASSGSILQKPLKEIIELEQHRQRNRFNMNCSNGDRMKAMSEGAK